ncbi:MAG: hypothetical protein FWE57_11445 [Chitinispirillia bacterium]|nr:hypothetical protein [Chitinispirillia bacterium]
MPTIFKNKNPKTPCNECGNAGVVEYQIHFSDINAAIRLCEFCFVELSKSVLSRVIYIAEHKDDK